MTRPSDYIPSYIPYQIICAHLAHPCCPISRACRQLFSPTELMFDFCGGWETMTVVVMFVYSKLSTFHTHHMLTAVVKGSFSP